jgi:F-type H+-transporting ATPase subunit gamma
MSDSTAGLQRKIQSAGDLQGVVRTMKALAASSIGHYEQSVAALDEYYRTVELGLSLCFRHGVPGFIQSSSRKSPDSGLAGAIVFGSDQGLVGQFNERIAEHAIGALNDMPVRSHRVWAVGARVHGRLADAGLALQSLFAVPGSLDAIGKLVGRILIETQAGEDSDGRPTELYLFYNRPGTGGRFEPVSQKLLPLDDEWCRRLAGLPWPDARLPEILGDTLPTLGALVREYLYISLFRACAESLASENASRLAAMQRADKNIDELLEHLRGTFHRVRQSSIDEELFDVIAGFEALSPDSAQQNR